ncbi:unnamed protein product [Merluccius merluccius]
MQITCGLQYLLGNAARCDSYVWPAASWACRQITLLHSQPMAGRRSVEGAEPAPTGRGSCSYTSDPRAR